MKRKWEWHYKCRGRVLKRLGYDNYGDYMRSAAWKQIREKVLVASDGMCATCDDFADNVHHRKYDDLTMLGFKLDYLVPLCRDCHCFIEIDAYGKKLTDGFHIDNRLRILMKQAGKTMPKLYP